MDDLLRPVFSLDFDDIAALAMGAAAIVTAFRMKRTQVKTESKAKTINEEVDASVLGQFLGLTDRVADLEGTVATMTLELAEARAELTQALAQLAEMQKVEEYLRASLHEKDKEIADLRTKASTKEAEISVLRGRVKHLEDVCKRAGINGDGDDRRLVT